LDHLADQITLEAVRENLTRLPAEIYQTYDNILERVDKQGEERRVAARMAIAWVLFARRPLWVKELKHALAVRTNDEDLNRGRMPLTEDITEFCCGLVVVDASENKAKLVHYTAQDYFDDRTRERLFPGFELQIAQVCATYLTMKPLEQPNGLCAREL
jgi:hypothetical protein